MQSISPTTHVIARLLIITVLATTLFAAVPFVGAATGPIVLEAEHPNENIARTAYSWQLATEVAGFGGHGYMVAVPTAYHYFHSDALDTSPELRYSIDIPETNSYYIWVRSNNPSQDGNSVYVGLDGKLAGGLSTSKDGAWRWSQYTVDGERAKVKANAGNHTLSLWAREAGQQIDRVLLTTDESYTPTGIGPDAPGDHGATPTGTPTSEHTHGATPTSVISTPESGTATAVPTNNASAGHPAGCKTGEIFVDAQDWWMPGSGQKGDNFGHIHTSLCFPHNKTVSGNLTLTIISKLHHNPGSFYGLNVSSVRTTSVHRKRCSDAGALNCWRDRKNPRTLARCAATGGVPTDNGDTCTWTDRITIDTRDFDSDGWKQIRVRGLVREPDGRDQRTSTGLQIYVNNGRARKDYGGLSHGPDWIEGRGWYGGEVNYTNASIRQPPTGPVSGIWQPSVKMDRGADGIPATSWYAALDTDFHRGNQGIPLCPSRVRGSGDTVHCEAGAFNGRLRIDTTKLSNGWHRLFLKADARSKELDTTNSGVLAVWFEVRN